MDEETQRNALAEFPMHSMPTVEAAASRSVRGSPSIRTREERHRIIAKALVEYASGRKSLQEIADEEGLLKRTMTAWLLSDVPDEYKEAQQAGIIMRIIDADESLAVADDYVAIQRADRQAKYARWDAERRLPKLFSPRQEITGAGGGPVQIENVDPHEVIRRVAFLMARNTGPVVDVEVQPRAALTQDAEILPLRPEDVC